MLTGNGKTTFAAAAPQLERAITARSRQGDVPEAERALPMILLASPRAGSPLLPPRWPEDDRPQVLTGRFFAARVDQERVPFTAFNVVAVVRGSDPTLSRTYVAFGAHYDHIGVVPAVNGDSIANGADDDGSGTVSLLAIARAIQRAPVHPKRSTLFVWHVGEEKGLLGSAYFVQHATVPIDSIVAQLNADMIGRNAPPLLYTVGPRAAPNNQSRRLGAVVDSVNASEPLPFAIDRSWDSATHPEHIYERSDHFNYARMGIPVVFFTTGMHDDYHMPGDAPSKIDYEKLARVARLMRDVGIAVGNSSTRPR
jgi:Zn-dependent M28 family amino/carboxypeptidase